MNELLENSFILPDKNKERSEFKRTLIKLGIFGVVLILNNLLIVQILVYPFALISEYVYSISFDLYYFLYWTTNEICVYLTPMLTLYFLFRDDLKKLKYPKDSAWERDSGLIVPLVFFSSSFVGSVATIITETIADILDKLFGTGEIPDAMEGTIPPEGETGGLLIVLFFTIAVAPVCEELMMRKLILYPLRKHGNWFAVIVSALVFGAVHGNWDQFPYAFSVGILYGLLAAKSGSVIPTMILHSVNNLLVMVGSYLTKVTGEIEPFITIQGFVTAFLGLCFWLGIFATVILFAVKFHRFQSKPILDTGEKVRAMLVNPGAYALLLALVLLMAAL